jgi:hypothetical protein
MPTMSRMSRRSSLESTTRWPALVRKVMLGPSRSADEFGGDPSEGPSADEGGAAGAV